MELDPNKSYNPGETKEWFPEDGRSPEGLLPEYSLNRSSHERLPASKTFEELVHDALAEELKFERDPALRDQASERANEILAEFQKAKQLQDGGVLPKDDEKPKDEQPPQTVELPSVKSDSSPPPVHRSQSGYGASFGLPDLVMISVIAFLLIIIILLLIF